MTAANESPQLIQKGDFMAQRIVVNDSVVSTAFPLPVTISNDRTTAVPITPVDLTNVGNITTQNLNPLTGVATPASFVAISNLKGMSSCAVQVTGTYTGVLSAQVSIDGANWVTLAGAASILNVATAAVTATIASAAVGVFVFDVAGCQYVRISGLAAMTGTAVVTLIGSIADAMTTIGTALPAGAANIGKINLVGNAAATLDGAIGGAASTNALWVQPAPSTAAAMSATVFNNAAVTVNNVKAGAGNLLGFSCCNLANAQIFLQFYNTAGTPTLGTSVIWSVAIPVGATLTIPPGTYALWQAATGIAIGASTTAASTGTPSTAPVVTVWYK